MKRTLSVICLVTLLLTMFIVPQAEAATEAGKKFAKVAEAEIGRKGSYYGYTKEWCAMFVKRCADQAGIGSSVPAQYNTAAMARWFYQNGQRFALTRRNSSGTIECWTSTSCTWSSSKPTPNYDFTPDVGDIAFFETDGIVANGIDHVAIVVAASGDWVTIVEGNSGNPNNSQSYVNRRKVNWRENNSKIWGFARPQACGSMSASSTKSSSGITTGPTVKVTTNNRGSSAVLQWSKVSGADFYEIELYDATGWKKLQNGNYGVYLQKKYNITGTSYVFSGLGRGKTYYVQIAACNKRGQWKFGPSSSFSISTGSTTSVSSRTTIATLISRKICRGYLTISSNQKAYTSSALSKSDGSYIYPSDYCRIIRASGNSLLVEYPTSGGAMKQRWIAASKFFCQYNYSVWSKTASQNITVKSRPGTGVTVGTIYKNDQVYVLGVSGTYYQVLYPAGSVWKFGYIAKNKL